MLSERQQSTLKAKYHIEIPRKEFQKSLDMKTNLCYTCVIRKGKERKKMDKTKTYILQFNEEKNRWEINSNDLQQFGYAYDTCLVNEEKDFAAALAVLDLCGYDLGIIQEELGIER